MDKKYTHVVIDESNNNFKKGTKVFIIESSFYDTLVISDGNLVKLCFKNQLKSLEDFE